MRPSERSFPGEQGIGNTLVPDDSATGPIYKGALCSAVYHTENLDAPQMSKENCLEEEDPVMT